MPVRIHAGRFDPKFLGVAIRAASATQAHSFMLTDRERRPPLHVLGSLGDGELVSDLSRLTVLTHELRHFHDALLLPLGRLLTRLRVTTAVNGLAVALALRRNAQKADTLPVPLQGWLRMDRHAREATLAQFAWLLGRAVTVPELPVLRADLLRGLAPGVVEVDPDTEALVLGSRVALADYDLIESLWRSPHGTTEAARAPAIAIWEAVGYLCQLAAVEELAGSPLCLRFQEWVAGHGPPAYRRGLEVLHTTVTALGWQATPRNLLLLGTWGQLGEYATEKDASSPLSRLGGLFAAARKGARWSDEGDAAGILASWDEVVGTDSVATLRECRHDVTRAALPPLQPEPFAAVRAAQQDMVRLFLEDPDAYVDPATYLATAERYPRPCVGVTYPDEAQELQVWDDATPPGWSPVVTVEDTLPLTRVAEVSDAIFLPGDKSLQAFDRASIAAQTGLEAVRVMTWAGRA